MRNHSQPTSSSRSGNGFRTTLLASLVVLLSGIAGCAATPEAHDRNARDPLEPFNRASYRVHEVGDRYLARPIASGYRAITPGFVRAGIGNFFSNLSMPGNIINGLLQGKVSEAIDGTGRLVVNTTVGIGGLFDVATRIGLEEPDEDFGQTLAVWGVPSGPYVFVPFYGPTTFRDGIGRFGDGYVHPLYHYGNSSVRDKLTGLYAVHTRAGLLAVDRNIDSAPDPYVFVREAYFQYREYQIRDGEMSDEDLYDMYGLDDLDDLEPLD